MGRQLVREWRPVVGFEGRYFVSNYGEVLSFAATRKGKLMTPSVRNPKKGYLGVCLSHKGASQGRMFNLHRLVAEAFIGPKPAGMHTMHIDDDKLNNRADNLKYGTPLENQRALMASGNHFELRKTHCKWNHPLFGPNLYLNKKGHRVCRTCNRESRKRRAAN